MDPTTPQPESNPRKLSWIGLFGAAIKARFARPEKVDSDNLPPMHSHFSDPNSTPLGTSTLPSTYKTQRQNLTFERPNPAPQGTFPPRKRTGTESVVASTGLANSDYLQPMRDLFPDPNPTSLGTSARSSTDGTELEDHILEESNPLQSRQSSTSSNTDRFSFEENDDEAPEPPKPGWRAYLPDWPKVNFFGKAGGSSPSEMLFRGAETTSARNSVDSDTEDTENSIQPAPLPQRQGFFGSFSNLFGRQKAPASVAARSSEPSIEETRSSFESRDSTIIEPEPRALSPSSTWSLGGSFGWKRSPTLMTPAPKQEDPNDLIISISDAASSTKQKEAPLIEKLKGLLTADHFVLPAQSETMHFDNIERIAETKPSWDSHSVASTAYEVSIPGMSVVSSPSSSALSITVKEALFEEWAVLAGNPEGATEAECNAVDSSLTAMSTYRTELEDYEKAKEAHESGPTSTTAFMRVAPTKPSPVDGDANQQTAQRRARQLDVLGKTIETFKNPQVTITKRCESLEDVFKVICAIEAMRRANPAAKHLGFDLKGVTFTPECQQALRNIKSPADPTATPPKPEGPSMLESFQKYSQAGSKADKPKLLGDIIGLRKEITAAAKAEKAAKIAPAV